MYSYRIGTPEDVPQIVELLEGAGFQWPGMTATPYVAVDDLGRVMGVHFINTCFHVDPFAAVPGAGVSVTEFAKIFKERFTALANEIGASITVYAFVQNNPVALEAARKNGMTPVEAIPHLIRFEPTESQ